MAVGQKAVVANALKTGWQCVDQKTPLEFLGVQRHGFRFLAVFAPVVFPLKRDPVIF